MLSPYFLNCFLHCLPSVPIILFLTQKFVSFPVIQSPVLNPNHKRKLRKPNSAPNGVRCSAENTAHGESVMLHNDCKSTQYLPISSISCSVVASSTVSSPGPSSLLAQILNTYVVLGSSRYTSICRWNINMWGVIFSQFSVLLTLKHCGGYATVRNQNYKATNLHPLKAIYGQSSHLFFLKLRAILWCWLLSVAYHGCREWVWKWKLS